MRSRALPAFGISVVALALATSVTPLANASTAGPSAGSSSAADSLTRLAGSDAVCASNLGAPSGQGIGSQDFESAFDAYDDMGAADFKLTSKCKVTKATAPGQFSVAGPVETVKGTIYSNKASKPAKVLCTGKGVGPGPDITATKFKNKKGKACVLKAGTYWLSMVAQMDFDPNGQWYWNSTTAKQDATDQWQNPGGGFGICPTWDSVLNCIGVDEDYIFTLEGK